ncbi:MAG: Leu/Phe/Val dehydrogenase [Hyphomicrobiales bacterium]
MLKTVEDRAVHSERAVHVGHAVKEGDMSIFSHPDFDAHEAVHAFFDAKSGLKGFIALHSTALGPGFGGCRMWPYGTEAEALRDALRLSRGMSYKNALAGLSYGGGKAVIIADSKTDKTPELFEAFGTVIEGLDGRYLTAEDVGVCVEDMKIVARKTGHVSGIGQGEKFAGGDPSPITAYGVYLGIRAAVRHKLGAETVKGLRVAVQGVGNVGFNLCKYLHDDGARLVVADVYEPNVRRAVEELGAEAVAPDDILFEQADVLAPCALGGVINAETVSDIQAGIVAGAANNQLGTEADGASLQARGIAYAPDYVVNSGGIMAVAAEHEGGISEAELMAKVERIYDRTLAIFERADEEVLPTSDVADQMAREVIAAAG